MISRSNLFNVGDPMPKPQPLSPMQLALQNQFAKNFGMRRGLMNAQDLHVGDTGAPFVDEQGNPIQQQPQQRYPYGTITDIRQIPPDISGNILKFDTGKQLNYYEDDNGDPVYVSHEIAASNRFNPNRGQYKEDLIAKK